MVVTKRQRVCESLDVKMTTGSCVIEPFGEDSIHEIISNTNEGNPNFTRGAFGEISIALRRREVDGELRFEFVAIKTIEQAISSPVRTFGFGKPKPKQEQKLAREVFNELCALSHLSPHPNIVPFVACFPSRSSHLPSTALSLGFVYTPVDLYITLEWRRRTCLPPLSFDLVKTVAYDLFSALAHCHELGVLHRDVKPGNLLVSPTGTIQLCDFGLAKPFLDEHGSDSLVPIPASGETGTKGLCTLFYRPPEILLGGPANHPSIDMYSAGTVLVELIAGRPLFQGNNVVEQLSLIFDKLGTPSDDRWPTARLLPDYGKLNFASREPKTWSQSVPRIMECKNLPDFVDLLVALDPSQRISAAVAMEHSLFKDRIHSSSLHNRLTRELIPPALQIPPLQASDNKETITSLALVLATKRRTFFSKLLSSWSGSDLPTSRLLR